MSLKYEPSSGPLHISDLHAAGHEGVDEEEAGHPEHGWLRRVDPLLQEVQPGRGGAGI